MLVMTEELQTFVDEVTNEVSPFLKEMVIGSVHDFIEQDPEAEKAGGIIETWYKANEKPTTAEEKSRLSIACMVLQAVSFKRYLTELIDASLATWVNTIIMGTKWQRHIAASLFEDYITETASEEHLNMWKEEFRKLEDENEKYAFMLATPQWIAELDK